MAFHVGQKVVCVDDSPSSKGVVPKVVKGRVYTIISFEGTDAWGDEGYLVAEAEPSKAQGHRYGFRGNRFAPYQERKTDISVFTEMLKPKQRELCGND